MIMRRWSKGIQPIDTSGRISPEWITFRNVPPAMISVKGVSWLASMIGAPLKKFVREGLEVKVCILRDKSKPCPAALTLIMEDGENVVIEVVQAKAREYRQAGQKVWRPTRVETKEPEKVVEIQEGNIENGVVPDIVVEERQSGSVAQTPEGMESGSIAMPPKTSTLKRRRNRKNKKSAQKGLSEDLNRVQNTPDLQEAGNVQSDIITGSGTVTGNVPTPSCEGTGSPTSLATLQKTDGNAGKDVDNSLERVEVESWKSDEEDIVAEPTRRVTLMDFMPQGKNGKQKKVDCVSGVKTRYKAKHR
ncbi:hypothetical protein LINPERPRIM_LOCUS30880 [Linum perenne]